MEPALFSEVQRSPWWVYAVVAPISLFALLGGFAQVVTNHEPSGYWLGVGFALFGMMPTILVGLLKLETQVHPYALSVKFFPFHRRRRTFAFRDMASCRIRRYSPISEFGGWGLRRRAGTQAYTMKGDVGLQVHLRDGRSFLIGTGRPAELDATLRNLFSRPVP